MNSNSSLPKDQTRTSIVNAQENENKLDWFKASLFLLSKTYIHEQ